MRYLLILIVFEVFSLAVYAQKPRPFVFNECGIFVNDALPVSSDYKVNGQTGSVLGAYHSFRSQRRVNPILGIEYNLMRFSILDFYDAIYFSDVQCNYHLLKLPFSLRIYFDKEHRVFIEPGIYVAAPVKNTYTITVDFSSIGAEKETIKDHFASTPGAGCSLGMGARFPLKKGSLFIKGGTGWGVGSVLLGKGYTNEATILYSPSVKLGVIYQFRVHKNHYFK